MDRIAPTDPNQEALRKVMAEKKRIKVETEDVIATWLRIIINLLFKNINRLVNHGYISNNIII